MSNWNKYPDVTPPGNDAYLVTITTFGGSHVVRIASYTTNYSFVDEYKFHENLDSGFYDYDSEYGYYLVRNVIAWMPLPEPAE